MAIQNPFKILNEEITRCRRCKGLNIPGETMSAPGAGNHKAKVFVVGQSLHSYNSDTPVQIPFVGPIKSSDSGVLLYEILEKNGITLKENLFITNVVHCHTPNNRPSLHNEIMNCMSFLKQELNLVKPRLIIAIGSDARNWFCLPTLGSGKFVRLFKREGNFKRYYIVAHHPSYILRYCLKKDKAEYEKQFSKALRKAKSLELY